MIDLSLLWKVEGAVIKHAGARVDEFRKKSHDAKYFGGWTWTGGISPIEYVLFVDCQRIPIKIGVDELEELIPEESFEFDFEDTTGLIDSLGCMRFCLRSARAQVDKAIEDFISALERNHLTADKESFLSRIESWGEEETDAETSENPD